MATVSDLLHAKASRPVLTIEQRETVLSATQQMNEHSVGALLVTESGRLTGIFTERDVLRRVVAARFDGWRQNPNFRCQPKADMHRSAKQTFNDRNDRRRVGGGHPV